MKTAQSITITGAGLAGSLLAVMLAQRGFDVALYEKRQDLRKHAISAGRSINLALAARGIAALQTADLFEAVQPLLIPMPGRQLHDREGKLQFHPYSRNPEEVNYSVSRGGLNAVLLDAAEATGKVKVYFEHAVEAYDCKTGELRLNNTATQQPATITALPLIATDGAGSVIRHAMVQQGHTTATEDLLPHGYKELVIPPQNGTHQMRPDALHIWPRGGYMLIALPNLDGSFTVTLFLPHEGEPGFDQLTSPVAVQDFFAREFPDALALMPSLAEDFFTNPTGIMGTVRCTPWHVGDKALLLGDAAHAIVPFHGQGMNCAFEDCRVLTELLDRHGPDWATIFSTISANRKADADAIADMALENYVEMRDTVRDPKFQLQKQVGWELEKRLPGLFIPRYEMVMFHPEISYAEAQRRGAIQQNILATVTATAETQESVDLQRAEQLAREKLTV